MACKVTKAMLLQRFLSSAAVKNRVGLIGLGMVGSVLSKTIGNSQMYDLSAAFDIDKSKYKNLPNGVKKAETCKEVVDNCDILITSLPKPPDVREAYTKLNGIRDGIRENLIWIDHTTSDYSQTQEIGAEVAKLQGQFLEAPITGGMEALKRGQMTALLAGDRNTADKVMPLMQLNFQQVFYLGPLGSALIVKVLSNMLNAVQIVSMAEALAIIKKANIDLVDAWHAIRASSGNSFGWETGAPEIFSGRYDTSFSIDLHNKDIDLGYQIARKHGVSMELMGLTQQLFYRTQLKYGKDAGCYSYPRLVEDDLKIHLQVPGFEKWSWGIGKVDGTSAIKHYNLPTKKDVNPKAK